MSTGYLVPSAAAAPLYDDALDDLLQTVFVGVTGLPAPLVRPRYQVKPPKQPDTATDWCAVGVMHIDRDANPVLGFVENQLMRHEEIHVLASFYGPHAGTLAATAADGLSLLQNNAVLALQLMLYVNNDTIRQVPELVGEQWIRRFDLPIRFRRQIKRTYAVGIFVSADSVISHG